MDDQLLATRGGRYTGKLTVSTDGLRFETLYESSNKTVVKAIFLDVATFTPSTGTPTMTRRLSSCQQPRYRG